MTILKHSIDYTEQMKVKEQIPRTSLMELLDSFIEKRVIYIHAPAGFSKTVSSLLWLEHRKTLANSKRTWISLDEHYNKTSAFCLRFVSELAKLQPRNTALRELAAHPSFNTASVEFTLRALDVCKENKSEWIFVLDDLHNIENDEILNLLPGLFKRLPGSCTALLLSRTAPPDSFSEMAAKEELAVVDARYLQFTDREIKLFFENNGQFISNRQTDEIMASTGGWAIGIRAMLLSKESSYSFNLADRYFENFLKTHVWERWDEKIKNFMTLISVADELTPEFCEWLKAGEKSLKKLSSTEILSELARENAFLRESGRNAYRFHDLFRDFLLKMLEENGEQALNKQWNRAGDWFFDKKDYFRAIEYYLKGKNDEGIAKSIHSMYDNHKSPSASIEETLRIVRLSLNDSIIKKYPFLLEPQVWAAFVEGRIEELESNLDRYYQLIPEIVLINPRSAVSSMLLRCMDYREPFIKTMKTLRRIPFKGYMSAATPTITFNMPLFHRSCRDYSELSLDLDQNILLTKKGMSNILGHEFLVIKECFYAGFSFERGNMGKAHEHALLACANIPENCSAEVRFCAMMMLVSVLLAVGNKAEANRVFDSIENMIETQKAFYLEANLDACFYRLRLADGDKESATSWLKNHNINSLENLMFFKLYQYLTTARAHIVLGNYTDAILLLQKLLVLCERYQRPLDIIEAHILLAVIYWKRGRSGHGQPIALEHLEKAAMIACEYGYTQPFANEGADIVNILHRMQKRAIQKEYTDKIPAEFVKTLHIVALEAAKRSKGLTGGGVSENLTFTNKQKTVMRLMCEGFSRNEIAEKMGLKPYGVKSHTNLIYKKLDVSGSLEAVMKIRELGVLGDGES
ncbi:MAG: LuxR C-terminal-related transcriptional regulator [Lachnospiraceae bacterium]|nr:LuxR C-terminal-related transcriptional regulator [Lachnospiraceae bacterium]